MGYVEGTVKDENGNVLQGAGVVLTPASSNSKETTQTTPASCEAKKGSQTAKSGANGLYKYVAVRPGKYSLCYSLEGYETIFKEVEIKQAVTNTFNIVLRKPAAAQTTEP